KITHKYTIFSAFILSALFIMALTGFGVLLFYVFGMIGEMDNAVANPTFLLPFTLWQIVLSVIAVFLMKKMQVYNINDFKIKDIAKGFLLGWFNFVWCIFAFLFILMSLPENSIIMPSPPALLITILHPFIGTGMFEEILIRGLILKLLLLAMGHTKKGIINACLISSAIFGILHIMNIVIVGDLLPVIAQVIWATFFGVFYAALFLRTKTLWIPILLHGLTNVSTQIFNVIVSPDISQNQTASGIANALTNVALALPFLIVGLILLRKVKVEDVECVMQY
ncbi:MAG: CPBP family intramembrane metalloprotease, partial [Oscillospiraceae bacterium]|nr:CPBP family intramembrane metalloprotease [Oscillospiraceae bacterium]